MISINIKTGESIDIPDGAKSVVIDGDVAKVYFSDDKEFIDSDIHWVTRIDAKACIKKACSEKITKGFSSSATGADDEYRSDIIDQINIISLAVSKSGGRVSGKTEKKTLSAVEVDELNNDMVSKRNTTLADKDKRYIDVDLASTEDEIRAIVERDW